ncbi:MAG: hypothetical protein V8R40_09195 [Dysosmobacter sp.]
MNGTTHHSGAVAGKRRILNGDGGLTASNRTAVTGSISPERAIRNFYRALIHIEGTA